MQQDEFKHAGLYFCSGSDWTALHSENNQKHSAKVPLSLRQRNEICFNCEVNAFQLMKTTEGRESQTESTAEGSCGKILEEQKTIHFHGAPKRNCRLDDSCF